MGSWYILLQEGAAFTLDKLKEILHVAAHQLGTKMILQFSVFSFDSSHIAGNIQDQFPDKGSVFLQYNSIWRPSNLFTRVLIVPQVWYLQVGIWKNRFCMLFWDPHVTPGPVCHVCRYTLQSEVQGTTPVQDKESRILTDSTYIGNNSRVIHIAYFSCLM